MDDKDQTHKSLRDLPQDIIHNVIPTVANPNLNYASCEATGVMIKLAKTHHALHTLFKPELDKRGAKQLLTYILQPTKKNAMEVVKIVKSNPKLFFIKSSALDYAMDLNGRQRMIADWSPYQALLGTSNNALFFLVKPFLNAYLATLTDGFDMAAKQVQEKFSNGLDFPPCTDEFIQLVDKLEFAITHDKQLSQDWRDPDPDTRALLAKFTNYYQPSTIQKGHHFNMNEIIKTYDIYTKNWKLWNWDQLAFLSVNIIGLQQRLLTGPYLDAMCTGYINKEQPLNGNFEIENFVTERKISVIPFVNEDPFCRLGEGYVISHDGLARLLVEVPQAHTLENYVKKTQQCLKNLCGYQQYHRFHPYK